MDIFSIRVCILLSLTAWYAIPSFAEITSIQFDHHPLSAKVQLVASGTVSANATDLSNLDEILEEGTPHNRLGGFSAIEYQGQSNRYWILPDRGPSDRAPQYACRVHEVELVPFCPANLPKTQMRHRDPALAFSSVVIERQGRNATKVMREPSRYNLD